MNAYADDSGLRGLKRYVDALRNDAPGQDRVEQAQQRLMVRLAGASESVSRAGFAWRPIAWAVPLMAGVAVAIMLFLGGPGGPRAAFADVQRYFNEFVTLHARSRMEVMGEPVMDMDVYLERGGRARIDMSGQVSYIVDPDDAVMITLLHDSRTAHRTPLPPGDHNRREELEWLEKIRNFQGQAQLLAEQRRIGGRLANGFHLVQNGTDMTLWAAADDATPLRLIIRSQGLMQMQLDFRFDQPLPTGLMETALPSGYRWLGPDEDPS